MVLLKKLVAFVGLMYLLRCFYDGVNTQHLAHLKAAKSKKRGRGRGRPRKTVTEEPTGLRHSHAVGRGVIKE